MTQDRDYGFGTRAIHAGAVPDPVTGARATPIHQTTSFVFDSAEHAASLFNLQTFGNVYSRISNPTVAVLEERVASLEGGRAALACATGMAAQMTALLAILKAGDHIVAASTLYGGTVGQLGIGFSRLGIETTFVDPEDPENFRRAIRPNTRAVYGETLANPLVSVFDIEPVAKIAHEHGLPLVIDNTVASPYLCNPFAFGATSWCTARPSTWAATVRPWPAWWWSRASSTGARRCRRTSSPRCWSPARPTTA